MYDVAPLDAVNTYTILRYYTYLHGQTTGLLRPVADPWLTTTCSTVPLRFRHGSTMIFG